MRRDEIIYLGGIIECYSDLPVKDKDANIHKRKDN